MYFYVSKRTFHQLLTCFPVLFGNFLIGVGWGWIAPTILKLQSADSILPLTEAQASWIASISEVGRFGSPFICPFIVDKFGRKHAIALVTILFLLVWPSLIVHSFYVLCLTRVIFGVASALLNISSSVYVMENCSDGLRGITTSMTSILFSGGNLFGTVLTTYLTYDTTALINTLFSICAFGSVYYAVETPHFLIMKGEFEEAKSNLMWLRCDLGQNDIDKELEKIKHSVEEENGKKKTIRTLLSSRTNLRSICLVLSMYFIYSLTGVSSISPHTTMIFSSSEIFTCYHFSILYTAGNFLFICISPFIIERINRKTLSFTSLSIVSFLNLVSCVLFYLHNRNYEIKYFPWLIFVSVSLMTSIRTLGSPVLQVLGAEILPMSVRAIGGSMATVINAGTGFAVTKLFIPVTESMGMETNFLAYSLMNLVLIVFIYYFMPETRGKSLEEIQSALKKNKRPDKSIFNKNDSKELP